MTKNENVLCTDCEHYGKEEYINGECQFSHYNNLDYCQYKKKENDNGENT